MTVKRGEVWRKPSGSAESGLTTGNGFSSGAVICYVQFDRRPSHNTVKQVLADGPPPSRTTRQYPLYAGIPDPAERRLAVIRLHAQGWSVTSIGAYLQVARKTIYQILKRWVEEGVRGLEDKSHANTNRP